eukprot:scaffold265627_cov36-Tisochrysis_lutea.AAC.1
MAQAKIGLRADGGGRVTAPSGGGTGPRGPWPCDSRMGRIRPVRPGFAAYSPVAQMLQEGAT